MKKLIIAILILLIISIIVSACSDNEEEFDYQYDGDVYFTLKFDTTTTNDSYEGFRLYILTKEIFPCYNYYIVTEEEINSSKIKIHILDVDIDEICATASGPAKVKIPLTFESDNYELLFYNSSEIDTYNISVYDDSIATSITDTSFTKYFYPSDMPWY